ncbi:MAG: MFS transporter [Stappiaceae bacterium]
MRASAEQKAELVLAGLCCFCAGGLYGWSALISAIQEPFGVSTAQIGLIFSFAVLAFTAAVLVAPYLPPTLKGLSGGGIFGLCGALLLALSATASAYIYFVVTFSLGFGAVSGFIYINTLDLAARSQHPKLLSPIMVATFGMGGVVFGPAWRLMIAQGWGLKALWLLSVLLGAVSILSILTARKTSEKRNDDPQAIQSQVESTLSPTHAGVYVWLIFALGSVGGLMVLGLASKILDDAGGSVALTSIALGCIAVGNTTGRLSVAGFNSRLNPLTTTIIATLTTGLGLIVTAMSSHAVFVAVGLSLVALGYGITASAIPSLTRQLFGEARFFRAFAVIFTAWAAAGLLGPWMSGAIFDQTGGFGGAILAALTMTAGAVLTVLLLRMAIRRA